MLKTKTTLSDLKSLSTFEYTPHNPRIIDEPAIYLYEQSSLKYYFAFYPKLSSKMLFVFFAGDAPRVRYVPPVFQRWSWAKLFPGSCLYVSDPVLLLSEKIGLSWYSGTPYSDSLEEVALLINSVASTLDVNNNIITYGSSGGGFASLRFSTFLNVRASVAINPQTNIAKYKSYHPDLYFKEIFGVYDRDTMLHDYGKRISLYDKSNIDKISSARIIYLQNTMDKHHYDNHYAPFKSELEKFSPSHSSDSNVEYILYSDPMGHKTVETQSILDELLSKI